MLTVTKLGLPPELRRSLACTNIIENVMGTVRRVCRNVNIGARRPWLYVGLAPPCRKPPRDSGGSRLTNSFRFCKRRSPRARQEPLHRTSILSKPRRLRRFSISDARFALFNIKWDIAWILRGRLTELLPSLRCASYELPISASPQTMRME